VPRIVKRSPLNRKPANCLTCGKYNEKPYVYEIVPTHISIHDIPPYSKSAEKVKRDDLTGFRKVRKMTYCNVECKENYFNVPK